MHSLKGKVTFITGAGSGIGRQIAISMAEYEAVIIASDIDFSAAKDTVYEIEKLQQVAHPVMCDITDAEQVETCRPHLDLAMERALQGQPYAVPKTVRAEVGGGQPNHDHPQHPKQNPAPGCEPAGFHVRQRA